MSLSKFYQPALNLLRRYVGYFVCNKYDRPLRIDGILNKCSSICNGKVTDEFVIVIVQEKRKARFLSGARPVVHLCDYLSAYVNVNMEIM